jgi:hypothetical protein
MHHMSTGLEMRSQVLIVVFASVEDTSLRRYNVKSRWDRLS